MEKVNGEIQYIGITNEGIRNGKAWKLYSIKVNDIFYSGFGNEYSDPYCHYKEGDKVIINYDIDDKYKNNKIKSIKLYSPKVEQIYNEYVNNPLKQEMNEPIQRMINTGIFSGEFDINGELYEINIKKK